MRKLAMLVLLGCVVAGGLFGCETQENKAPLAPGTKAGAATAKESEKAGGAASTAATPGVAPNYSGGGTGTKIK